jgi:hypothetical protein
LKHTFIFIPLGNRLSAYVADRELLHPLSTIYQHLICLLSRASKTILKLWVIALSVLSTCVTKQTKDMRYSEEKP